MWFLGSRSCLDGSYLPDTCRLVLVWGFFFLVLWGGVIFPSHIFVDISSGVIGGVVFFEVLGLLFFYCLLPSIVYLLWFSFWGFVFSGVVVMLWDGFICFPDILLVGGIVLLVSSWGFSVFLPHRC